MFQHRLVATGAALLGTFLLAACGEAPVAPDPDPSLTTHGPADGPVTLPFRAEASFTWDVPDADAGDCPELTADAVGDGEGRATHLGRFRVVEQDHPTINLCSLLEDPPAPPAPEDVSRRGTFEWIAADGSALRGSYEFVFLPPGVAGSSFTWTVDGGTRRFAGASGTFSAILEESGAVECVDPLCLEGATWTPVVVEGEVTLPRP